MDNRRKYIWHRLNIDYENRLESVDIEFFGVENSITIGQKLPGYDGLTIKKAILANLK